MGLLDQFGGMTDDQTQGLLAAAAQMLQASGPSTRPMGIGQILGGGMGAYQDSTLAARKRKLEEDQAKQMAELRGLQIQDATGVLKDHDTARAQAQALRQFYVNRANPGAAGAPSPAQATPADPMASAMPGGDNSPKVGGPDWMQAYQASQPQGAMSAAPQAAQASPAALGSPYAQRMAEAQALRGQGFHAQADAAELAALKFKPEFSTEPRVAVGPDGKPYTYVMDKEGNKKVLDGVLPRDEMKLMDNGKGMQAYNPYALTPGQSFQKFQSPDSAASVASAAAGRAQAERHWKQEQADANEPGKPNETLAKQIAGYKNAPLGQFNLNKPWGQATMDRVLEINPSYDAAQFAPRAAALRAYAAGGKEALSIDSVNIGMNHVATLRELALAQKTGNVMLFNKLANAWATQTGQPAPTNLRMAADMVAPEIVKAVAGVAGTGEERAHFAQSLTGNGSYSPDQIIGATGKVQELFAGRLSEKKRSYERSTQLDNFDAMLSPAAQALIKAKDRPAPTAASIPRDAANLLKLNPKLRDQFDAKYGTGASDSVLGK